MFKSINWKFVFRNTALYSVLSSTIGLMIFFIQALASNPVYSSIVNIEAGGLLGFALLGYMCWQLADIFTEPRSNKPEEEPESQVIIESTIAYLRRRLGKA